MPFQSWQHLTRINAHPRDEHIRFHEPTHKYYVNGTCEGNISCTGFIHEFFGHFDPKAILTKMRKNPTKWAASNYFGKTDEEIMNHDYIMIDEGQFFSDLKEYVLKWCEVFKKNIIVIGLDGDYKRNTFGQILDLIPVADQVTKLKALCKLCNDGTEALFTHRLSEEDEQVVISYSKYIPVCRQHYLEQNFNFKN